MITINWKEYKDFKKYSSKGDNFVILLNFLKSYYNMINPVDIYEVLYYDDTAKLMLDKRSIASPEDLETFLFKQ